jgi:hypothetical protein
LWRINGWYNHSKKEVLFNQMGKHERRPTPWSRDQMTSQDFLSRQCLAQTNLGFWIFTYKFWAFTETPHSTPDARWQVVTSSASVQSEITVTKLCGCLWGDVGYHCKQDQKDDKIHPILVGHVTRCCHLKTYPTFAVFVN